MIEYIDELSATADPILLRVVFVLGTICVVAMLHKCLSWLYDILHAAAQAYSLTRCVILSAKQKARATNAQSNTKFGITFQFFSKNFYILHQSDDVEYISEDFRWNGIFDFDTYDSLQAKSKRG